MAISDDAGAVEYDPIISSHEIHEDDGKFGCFRSMGYHRASLAHLAFVEGRRINGDQNAGSHFNQLVGGIVCVQPFSPESLVIPEVFTDSNSEFTLVDREKATLTPRFKVSWIVEDVILRQQGFVREVYEGLDAVIPLGEVETALPLQEVYDGVEFRPEAEDGGAE